MGKNESYLGPNGEELHTLKGEVITMREVALEQVKHNMDESGNITLPTDGWYWLKTSVLDPNNSEWFATYREVVNAEGKLVRVPGGPESPRKINGVRLWYDENNPAKSQLIFEENDYNPDRGTVGELSPLVVKTAEGTFVAVQDASRFNLVYIEAFRRAWSRPKDEAPEVKELNDRIKVTKYTDEQLGLGVSNNARVNAPGGRKALISDGLTVLETDGSEKPEIKGARWIPVEEFITQTEEKMGKEVVKGAIVFGYLNVDPEKLKGYLANLPEHVRKAKEEVKKQV